MIEIIHDTPVIYKVSVPLPHTALRNLNCYIMKSGSESVIIDTGFNLEECRAVLMDALAKLHISPEHTNLLLTHFHSDHIGLAEYFDYPDSSIYMSETDFNYHNLHVHGDYWRLQDQIFLENGMPAWELEQSKLENPAIIYAPRKDFAVHTLKDGERICIGNFTFRAIEVTGHTPGQMCYYFEEEKAMFLGDHVLFDITPNIVSWPLVDGCLRKYLSNLDKIGSYDIRYALPGHRNLSDKTVYMRIEEIKRHHERRLAEVQSAVEKQQGINAYQVASCLTWSLRGKTWDTAPKQQKWFAMGEAMAHLEYLTEEGNLKKRGNRYYQNPLQDPDSRPV